ncbi:MAG: hypothetical protein NTV51_09190, partial [Verrucomicrobia bacterium]|nr:hypothetical protein [Verrucomicrobiota bacterium]
ARRTGENLIVEIKPSSSKFSVEQYNAVAETVSRHAGWRFILVTGDDSVGISDRLALPSIADLRSRRTEAEQLLAHGMYEAAFVLFWSYLEAVLRIRARGLGLAIDGFAISRLLKSLYSTGELSLPHFEQLSQLLQVRNQVVHGFKAPAVADAVRAVSNIVRELEQESAS